MFLIYDLLAVLSPERCQVALRGGRGDQWCSIKFPRVQAFVGVRPEALSRRGGRRLFARGARITTEVTNLTPVPEGMGRDENRISAC